MKSIRYSRVNKVDNKCIHHLNGNFFKPVEMNMYFSQHHNMYILSYIIYTSQYLSASCV